MNKTSNFLKDTIYALSPSSKKKENNNEVSKPSSNLQEPLISELSKPCLTHEIKPTNSRFKMHISLPEDLHRRFASRCAQDGRTKSGTIQLFIKQYLAQTAGDKNAF